MLHSIRYEELPAVAVVFICTSTARGLFGVTAVSGSIQSTTAFAGLSTAVALLVCLLFVDVCFVYLRGTSISSAALSAEIKRCARLAWGTPADTALRNTTGGPQHIAPLALKARLLRAQTWVCETLSCVRRWYAVAPPEGIRPLATQHHRRLQRTVGTSCGRTTLSYTESLLRELG